MNISGKIDDVILAVEADGNNDVELIICHHGECLPLEFIILLPEVEDPLVSSTHSPESCSEDLLHMTVLFLQDR